MEIKVAVSKINAFGGKCDSFPGFLKKLSERAPGTLPKTKRAAAASIASEQTTLGEGRAGTQNAENRMAGAQPAVGVGGGDTCCM